MGDIVIPLTEEQRQAVEYPDTLGLTSCPGSGKTRTILAKLLRCLDEVRGTPRRIACITFTNAGVNEIESRLRNVGSGEDGDLCEVSTIHSFCLNYVLRSYAHLIPHLRKGWSVVTTNDQWCSELIAELVKKYNIKPSLIDRFDGLQRQLPNELPEDSGLPSAAVAEFFARADAEGKITLGDIVFFAARIVLDNDFIASLLASRFAWFIVDEFQDTTAAQAAMLAKIYQKGRSKIFFVGDPNQSILAFAGAHPKLMPEFAKYVKAKIDIHLTGNFRSSKLILDHAEQLCSSAQPMVAVGKDKDFAVLPQLIHVNSPLEGIVEYFIPAIDYYKIGYGEAAILAPWWVDLLSVGRGLRERQIPIIGPGSRPYKRSHELALLSEGLAAYIVSQNPDTVAVIQRALFIVLSNITDIKKWEIFRYSGRRVVFRLIRHAKHVIARYEAVHDWLHHTAAGCETILIEEEMLTPLHAGVFTKSAATMVAEMLKHGVDVANMSATELGMIAVPKNCVNLLTMHQAKGREFDAVAVIAVHEGRVPHFTATKQAEFDEACRLLYVAATRARKLLMYFTDGSHPKNQPSRFLKKVFPAIP
jgi:DNA helicase II / ATP-dependent DNA helicase PcrA